MSERKATSIKIDHELWKEFKIYCIKIEKELSDKMENLIRECLKPKS